MTETANEPGDWFRTMCEHSPDFMVVIDRERRFCWVNRLHPGVSSAEVIGKPLETFEHPATHERSREATSKAFATGEAQSFESHANMPDGSESWFFVRCIPIAGHPDRLLLVTSDTTERKRAERDRDLFQRQLHQSRKMEAIGRLAGGIAHDFNNLLTPIFGHAQMALDVLTTDRGAKDADRRLADALHGVSEAAERAAELTASLLAIGRGQPPSATAIDLASLVHGMERLLRRVIPENVLLDSREVREGACVRADRGQLEQVLLNLVINACDAMPAGGRLQLGTDTSEREVALWVKDTGVGMSPDTMQRLFEPFFTTKGANGTGLGLATAHGIVEENGGRMAVVSELSQGSTFRVAFPPCHGPAVGAPKTADAREQRLVAPATVLVVEDQDMVRSLVVKLLEGAGYTVLSAESGAAALATARERATIDLVLTDVVMPGLSGPEVVRQLHTVYPQVRVLYMSGHAMNLLQEDAPRGTRLLRKPFTRTQLLEEVAAALRAVPSG